MLVTSTRKAILPFPTEATAEHRGGVWIRVQYIHPPSGLIIRQSPFANRKCLTSLRYQKVLQVGGDKSSLEPRCRVSFQFIHTEIPTYLTRQMFIDLPVTRHGGSFVLGGIVPPGMTTTFSK